MIEETPERKREEGSKPACYPARVKMLAILLFFSTLAGAAPPPGTADPMLQVRELFLQAHEDLADGHFQRALDAYHQAIALRPEDATLHFELAELLQQLNVNDQARDEALKAARLNPTFAEAWGLAGTIDLALAPKNSSRVVPAVDELTHAHELDPEDPGPAVALAQAQNLNGRPDIAWQVLQDYAANPYNPAYLKALATADDKRGADGPAAQEYERWMRSVPDDREVLASAIEFFESRQNYSRAIELLRRFEKADPDNAVVSNRIALDLLRSGRFSAAEKACRSLIAARPEDRAAQRTLAASLYQQGNDAASREILEKLNTADPADPSPVFTLAIERAADGQYDEALAVLKKFSIQVSADSEHADLVRAVQGEISAVEYQQKKLDAARQTAQAVATGEDWVTDRALNVLLQVARERHEIEDGLAWAKKAAIARPKNSDYRADVGEFEIRAGQQKEGEAALSELANSGIADDVVSACDVWARLKEWPAASAAAQAAISRFPGNTELLFRLGSSLERQGKIDESAAAFQKLLAIRPDDAQTLNYLGYTYADGGLKLAQALTMIEKAVVLDPRNGAYLDSLGWVNFKLNHLDAAKKYLDQAQSRMPNDPTVQEHLGDLAARLGQNQEALDHWKKSLSFQPDNPQKIEKKIRELSAQK